MAGERELKLTILGDNRGAVAAIDGTESRLGRFKGALGGVATVAGGFLAAGAVVEGFSRFQGYMGGAVDQASSLRESINAVQQVFGDSSPTIVRWGQDNATAFGLSQRAFNEMATPMGAVLRNLGFSQDQVADQTINLTQRAADMASVFNTDVEDALAAINSALRGEANPIERYGVSVTAAAVANRALADTGKTSAAQLTEQEKAAARLAIIFEQTEAVAGDFANTSGELANAERIQAARAEELQAKIGEHLLPVMLKWTEIKLALVEVIATKVLPILERFSGWIGENVVPQVQQLAEWIGPKLSAFIEEMAPKVQAAFGQLVGFWQTTVLPVFEASVDRWRTIIGFLEKNWPRISTIVMPVLNQVVNGIETTMAVIGRIITVALNLLAGDWEAAWSNLKEAAYVFWDGIVGTFENARDLIKGIIDAVIDSITSVTSKLDGLLGLTDRVGGALGGVGDFLGGAASGVGGLLGFDDGGVVPGPLGAPRLAIVHGGETVLPTHRSGVSAAAQTVNVTVNVAGSLRTEHELEDVIVRAVSRAGRNGEFRGVLT